MFKRLYEISESTKVRKVEHLPREYSFCVGRDEYGYFGRQNPVIIASHNHRDDLYFIKERQKNKIKFQKKIKSLTPEELIVMSLESYIDHKLVQEKEKFEKKIVS